MNELSKIALDLNKIKPGCKILLRVDLNTFVDGSSVFSAQRINVVAPIIRDLISLGAHVTLVTHIGRPICEHDFVLSTVNIIENLQDIIGVDFIMNRKWPFEKMQHITGKVVLADNVRFIKGEISNDENVSKIMAEGYDLFVLEAFGVAHRKHCSNYGVIDYCPSRLGPLFVRELKAMARIKSFSSPSIAIIGGGKNSTKLKFVEQLLYDFDLLLLGGQMANLFMCAKGLDVGRAVFDENLVKVAKDILVLSERDDCADIITPKDFWVDTDTGLTLRNISFEPDDNIIDIGPATTKLYGEMIQKAASVFFNGPMGLVEDNFCLAGTKAILQAMAKSEAETVIGGGDTNTVVIKTGVPASKFSFVSTGGGSLLYGIMHGTFPAVDKLKEILC